MYNRFYWSNLRFHLTLTRMGYRQEVVLSGHETGAGMMMRLILPGHGWSVVKWCIKMWDDFAPVDHPIHNALFLLKVEDSTRRSRIRGPSRAKGPNRPKLLGFIVEFVELVEQS